MTGHEVQCIHAATCRVLWRDSCPHREPHEHRPDCDVPPAGITECHGVCVTAEIGRCEVTNRAQVADLQTQRERVKTLSMTKGEGLWEHQQRPKRRVIEIKERRT